jgi:3-oxoacyl-[acyl-carrier-protein] synthase II
MRECDQAPSQPHAARARRVLVTGMGAISAAGNGVAAFAERLRGSETRIREISLFDTTGLRVRVAGEAALPARTPLLPRMAHVRASRTDCLALCALAEALAHAAIAPDLSGLDRTRVGVAVGSSTGGMLETEAFYETRLHHRRAGALRAKLSSTTVAAPADLVAAATGALGPRMAPSTACSSSAIAIAVAALWIRSGAADVVLTGGADALARMTLTGFHALQALSPEPCRPFDVERKGLSLGEGAGMLVLESAEHAARRGVPAIAEVAGAGLSCDASHLTAPHPEARGAVHALWRALAGAAVAPGSIDYLNAHGTGTPQNDAAESRAIREVFGEAAPRLPISSTKGLIGHLLGAAGAVEAIASLIAIRDGFVPPTVGLRQPDPAFALDFVSGAARERDVAVAVSSSYGFGGNNCSLVLRRATDV